MPSRVVKSNLRQKLLKLDKDLRRELSAVGEETGKVLKRDHEKVVSQWTHKPKFNYSVTVSRGVFSTDVIVYGANAKIWKFVNYGTKPHKIRAKNKPFLRFRTGYQARTARGGFGGPGRATGGWVAAKEVSHPGNAAREFTKQISKRARPRFRRLTEKAFRKAIRRNF